MVQSPNFPFTKEQQLHGRSKKARKKKRLEKYGPGVEEPLLIKCLGFLDSIDAIYFRLMQDWQWKWISWNAPKQLKEELSDNYSGWPDLMIFQKVDGNPNLNRTLLVELKSPGRKMHKSQTYKARDLNIRVITSYEVFVDLVAAFYAQK